MTYQIRMTENVISHMVLLLSLVSEGTLSKRNYIEVNWYSFGIKAALYVRRIEMSISREGIEIISEKYGRTFLSGFWPGNELCSSILAKYIGWTRVIPARLHQKNVISFVICKVIEFSYADRDFTLCHVEKRNASSYKESVSRDIHVSVLKCCKPGLFTCNSSSRIVDIRCRLQGHIFYPGL